MVCIAFATTPTNRKGVCSIKEEGRREKENEDFKFFVCVRLCLKRLYNPLFIDFREGDLTIEIP